MFASACMAVLLRHLMVCKPPNAKIGRIASLTNCIPARSVSPFRVLRGNDRAALRCHARHGGFSHTHLKGGADGLAPYAGPLLVLGPVIEHFFHAMFRRVAHVHAKQIECFARWLAIFGRPCVMHLFEYS